MASQSRHRMVVHELDAEEAEEGRMSGERGVGGVVHLCEHLADLITDNPTSSTR